VDATGARKPTNPLAGPPNSQPPNGGVRQPNAQNISKAGENHAQQQQPGNNSGLFGEP